MSLKSHKFLATILLAGAALLGLPQALQAQAPPTGSFNPQIATEGTFQHAQPHMDVTLDRESYVAIFQIEPEVGAVLLYPHNIGQPAVQAAGSFSVRMSGPQMESRRRMFRHHVGQFFWTTRPHRPFSHLVILTSERPLRLDGLLGQRVFRAGGFYSTSQIIEQLIHQVISPQSLQTGQFGWDHHRVRKFRSPHASMLSFRSALLGGSSSFCDSVGLGYAGVGELFISPLYRCPFFHAQTQMVGFWGHSLDRLDRHPTKRSYSDLIDRIADARNDAFSGNDPSAAYLHPRSGHRQTLTDRLQDLADRLDKEEGRRDSQLEAIIKRLNNHQEDADRQREGFPTSLHKRIKKFRSQGLNGFYGTGRSGLSPRQMPSFQSPASSRGSRSFQVPTSRPDRNRPSSSSGDNLKEEGN